MTKFEVHEVFSLKNGKFVFAGSYSSGVKKFGVYQLTVDGHEVALVNIKEEMHFSPKANSDIALCTADDVPRDKIDLTKPVVLTLAE